MIAEVPRPSPLKKDNPGPPDVLLGALGVRHNRAQSLTVAGGYDKGDSTAHPQDPHAVRKKESKNGRF